MSDDRSDRDAPLPPPDEIDPGEPVAVLADLREPVSTGFLDRVQRKIERRSLANEFASASWYFPVLVLLEILVMLFDFLGLRRDREGGSS